MSTNRYLGLDLGGTNIKAVVVEVSDNATPEVVYTGQQVTLADGGPQVVTDRLIELGKATVKEVGPVAAAGLGVPGLFEADTGRIVLFPNLPGPWPGHSLRDPVAEALGVPTKLINDARAFVLAEGIVGAGRGYRTLVGLTLGTGIGGGIMIEGRIHLGDFGIGGEIAHQIIRLAAQPQGVLYGVPGDPSVAEATTDLIRQRAGEIGLEVRIVSGLSFLELPTQTVVAARILVGIVIR